MTMKTYFFIIFLLILMGCEEIERGVPVSKNDIAPSPVSNVQVANIPGGATISYIIPKSDNLLYVRAEYSTHDGTVLWKNSSFLSNSITLEGFPDTLAYKVNLYSVSRGEKKSASMQVTIKPLTPPIISTFNSISIISTFGGVKINFENASEANLKIIVLTTDSLGDLYPAQTYYTKRKSGDFSVRGFAPVERRFGVFTLDRWDNHSDTLFVQLTPLYEEKLNKSIFKALNLPMDTYEPHMSAAFGLTNLWDNIWGTSAAFHTKPNTGIPQWFTIDLGVKAILSRFKFHHRLAGGGGAGTDGQYSGGDPEILEVYGSNAPVSNGTWESWTKLGQFQSVKPSGQAKWTNEDIQYACVDGEDFEFDVNLPYRYLRFKILKNWGGVSYIYMSELTFWGNVQK